MDSIQRAYVKAILDTTMEALTENENRTFTYVEQKFFSMWWNIQTNSTKDLVKSFVKSSQLDFVNGGWCMHDEAATHYMGMIDQTTLGHAFLKENLGVIPKVGWQLDPFGHSSTQSSFMSSLMGFDSLFFGRIDYQDLQLRHETRECEGLWDSSPNVGNPIFWGLTGSYGGNYGDPGGFCFDVLCEDDPIVGDEEPMLLQRVTDYVRLLGVQAQRTKGNHMMVTMGSDFQYQEAKLNFANLDLLIHSILRYQESKAIDIPGLLGEPYERIAVFYSNPDFYTKMKHTQSAVSGGPVSWSTKTDDFFPYADFPHAYWTGYFTSRPALKRLERVGSSFLLAARQIESHHIPKIGFDCCHGRPLYDLEDAIGVAQHHDGVSGTSRQHVAYDYAKKIQAGINQAAVYAADKIRKLLFKASDAPKFLQNLQLCQLLNETICEVSEGVRGDDEDVYVVVYNALGQQRTSFIGLPVGAPGTYVVSSLHDGVSGVIATVDNFGKNVVYFPYGPLPPAGGAIFRLRMVSGETSSVPTVLQKHKDTVLSNGVLELHLKSKTNAIRIKTLQQKNKDKTVDGDGSGAEERTAHQHGKDLDLFLKFGYYTSYDAGDQNSGAYIFRPKDPNEVMTEIKPVNYTQVKVDGSVVELRVHYEKPWVQQVLRMFSGQPYIDVEWQVGPIPVDDGVGKEVVARYDFNIDTKGVWYTDSNGREFQKRVRSFRPTWNLTEHEFVAGNYYPVNAASYMEDDQASVAIVTDRSQGVGSLADGSLEFMVHRRMIARDNRGVGECLNETDGGMTPYRPFGDATRIGNGLVVKGKHRIVCGPGFTGAASARSVMDGAFSEPLVFVATEDSVTKVPVHKKSFSLMKRTLPPNVMLITFAALPNKDNTFLVRLGHQYAAGEDPALSKPVTVCLFEIIGHELKKVTEKTLSGNRDYHDWVKHRKVWTDDEEDEETGKTNEAPTSQTREEHTIGKDGRYTVELKPMEIRTFEVKLEAIVESDVSTPAAPVGLEEE